MLLKVIALLWAALSIGLCAQAQEETVGAATDHYAPRDYTPSAPLIYEDVWDLAPYAFQNEDGEPAGFNIDLVKMVLDKLDIPYEIRLRHSPDNLEDLTTGDADLTTGMKAAYHDHHGAYGASTIALFTHAVAYPEGLETDIHDFEDLRRYKVVVHKDSYCYHYLLDNGLGDNVIPVDDIKEVIMKIAPTDTVRVLWNALSLRYLIRKYDLSHLTTAAVDMPYGTYHFISRDTLLLQRIDSVYNELTNADEILPLRRQWMYSDIDEKPATSYAWYVMAASLTLLLILLFYNIYYKVRERSVKRLIATQSRRLNMLMKSADVQIWSFDVRRATFTMLDPTRREGEEYDEEAFAAFYHPDDFNAMLRAISTIAAGDALSLSLDVRRRSAPVNGDTNAMRYLELNLSVLHRQGTMPTTILGAQRDITGERLKILETRDILMKYKTVFNTAMSDLTYYDSDGTLCDINARACDTFGITDRLQFIASNIRLTSLPMFRTLDALPKEQIWASTTVDLDRMCQEGSLPPYWTRRGKLSFEYAITPIYGDQGEILWYVSAGRDVTAVATETRRERSRINRIRRATENIRDYSLNIDYALQISNIQLANYFVESHTMEIAARTGSPKRLMTQVECIQSVDVDYRRRVVRLLRRMDKREQGEFSLRVKMRGKDKGGHNVWYEINGLPMRDATRHVNRYFCLCQNISLLVETERTLAQETQKAQEAETLKTSFFNNISREVSQPLHAVVDTARLFGEPHDKADEPLLTDTIKKNCDVLLSLVNSVLTLSRLDANMVESHTTAVNFPDMFRTHCMMGWTKWLNSDVNTIVESPYRQLTLLVDEPHLGTIIETLTGLAAFHTKKGQIRTRYTYREGTLTLSVEDTGEGMPPGIREQIMERRFTADDGKYIIYLQLEICLALAELMGGKMGIETELGHGTTIWVALPCSAAPAEPGQEERRTDNDI